MHELVNHRNIDVSEYLNVQTWAIYIVYSIQVFDRVLEGNNKHLPIIITRRIVHCFSKFYISKYHKPSYLVQIRFPGPIESLSSLKLKF